MENPFKFGSVVEEPYFTNRKEEIAEVKSVLNSGNHIIIISPRRYGKTSLINTVLKTTGRPGIFLDMQIIISPDDLASQLLKRLFKVYPYERIKNLIRKFRIIPSISLNPLTNDFEISFRAEENNAKPLEDVLELMNKSATGGKRLIVVMDEFQEIGRIGKGLDRKMRALMQYHKNINYVFLGSQESLIREIFEKKKSPFYHFGYLMALNRIPQEEFHSFLEKRFKNAAPAPGKLADEILSITKSHPYYTQFLAFTIWEIMERKQKETAPVRAAIDRIIKAHDNDYERLWGTLNITDMKIMLGICAEEKSLTSAEFLTAYNTDSASTIQSGIKRLIQKGFVIKLSGNYE
ncbi:MAG: ATP-binding protein, partial [Ignavibacteria bacterium]|nr:ATP-binding protein [Ignavibacteria bacterium]